MAASQIPGAPFHTLIPAVLLKPFRYPREGFFIPDYPLLMGTLEVNDIKILFSDDVFRIVLSLHVLNKNKNCTNVV
jgi:hypothetical protein